MLCLVKNFCVEINVNTSDTFVLYAVHFVEDLYKKTNLQELSMPTLNQNRT